MDTLDDLGAQLRALSGDQPAQPGDRVPGVTRRARRIRRTRAALSAAAALAVLAPVGVVLSAGQHDEATSFARSDLRSWPDRSIEADKGIGEGVLASLQADVGPGVLHVRWLYRAQVQLPDHNPSYVAVFTAEVLGQPTLVTATSFGHALDPQGRSLQDDPPTASWDTSDRTVLKPAQPLDHVGLYLPYSVGDEKRSLALVLADPRARELSWRTEPLAFAPGAPGVGTAASRNGVFLAPLGAVNGPAVATVRTAGGAGVRYALGTGASHPYLVDPAALDLPGSWQPQVGGVGTNDPAGDGRWVTPGYASGPQGRARWSTAFVRCYGGGTVRVRLQRDFASETLRSGTVACDDKTHRAFPPTSTGLVGTLLSFDSDRLQAIRFSYGSVA